MGNERRPSESVEKRTGRAEPGSSDRSGILALLLFSLAASALAQLPAANLSVGSLTPAPANALVGAAVTYTVSTHNAGPNTATNVWTTTVLPSSVSFNSGSAPGGACSQNCGTVSCPMGSMISGANASATISVTANTVGTWTAVAGIAANEFDPSLANESATGSLVISPGPTVTSVTPAFVAQKPTSSYTKTLTIAGANFQTGATVTIANVACSVTSVQPAQIQCTATVPAASGSVQPGFRSVTVTPVSGTPGTLANGLDLRRFADIPATSNYGLSIWKATTLHATMYDVVTTGTDGVTTNPDGTQNYNPSDLVERRDMARYVVRARGEAKKTGCGTPFFADVPCGDADWGWIEKCHDDGIVAGCGGSPPNYCPDAPVQRNQMAVFIEKGLNHAGSTTLCDAGHPPYFGDVPCADPFWKWVQELYEDGITAGCQGPPTPMYCPTVSISRDQMAVFVSKGWGY